jgi:hypothetical protein
MTIPSAGRGNGAGLFALKKTGTLDAKSAGTGRSKVSPEALGR